MNYDIRVGQRVRVVLPVRQPPGFKRTRNMPITGTVEALDLPGLRAGVKIRFDHYVNGVDTCYATYAEVESA